MAENKGLTEVDMDRGKSGKATLLGFLGISLACLGCCLFPALGTVAVAGLGASALALFRTQTILVYLFAVAVGFAVLWFWRRRSTLCCSEPSANCSSTVCKIRADAANERAANP